MGDTKLVLFGDGGVGKSECMWLTNGTLILCSIYSIAVLQGSVPNESKLMMMFVLLCSLYLRVS